MKTNSNKIKDQKFLHDYFKQHNMEVVYENEGEDETDDGYPFEYLSIIIQTDHKVLHPMYEFDDESTITKQELTEAMQNREVYLAEIKKRQEDYIASKKAAATPTPTPAVDTQTVKNGNFSF